ncbi:hypothetical protein [Streptomyces sp. NPDC018693]
MTFMLVDELRLRLDDRLAADSLATAVGVAVALTVFTACTRLRRA